MSLLLLIRHGQASFGEADYDQLSMRGAEQSRRLGTWLYQHQPLHTAWVGPRRRHLQTWEGVQAGARAKPWPKGQPLSSLDEYPADVILRAALPALCAEEPALAAELAAFQAGGAAAPAAFQRLFEAVTRRWVRDELPDLPDLPSWAAFRAQAAEALDHMLTAASSGQTVAAFSSGGAIAAMVGTSLGLSDEKTLELSWSLYNTALTELRFNPRRCSLASFNRTPHLPSAAWLTWR